MPLTARNNANFGMKKEKWSKMDGGHSSVSPFLILVSIRGNSREV